MIAYPIRSVEIYVLLMKAYAAVFMVWLNRFLAIALSETH